MHNNFENLKIYAINGRLVYTSEEKQVNIEDYINGVYFVLIENNLKETFVEKFIKAN